MAQLDMLIPTDSHHPHFSPLNILNQPPSHFSHHPRWPPFKLLTAPHSFSSSWLLRRGNLNLHASSNSRRLRCLPSPIPLIEVGFLPPINLTQPSPFLRPPKRHNLWKVLRGTRLFNQELGFWSLWLGSSIRLWMEISETVMALHNIKSSSSTFFLSSSLLLLNTHSSPPHPLTGFWASGWSGIGKCLNTLRVLQFGPHTTASMVSSKLSLRSEAYMGSSTMSNSAPFLMSISSSLFSSPPCSFKAFSKLKREGSPKYRWTMRPFWYHLFLAPIHSWRNLSHLLRNLHHQLLLQLLRQLLQDWMAFHKVLKPPLFLHPFLLCFLDLMKIFTFFWSHLLFTQ